MHASYRRSLVPGLLVLCFATTMVVPVIADHGIADPSALHAPNQFQPKTRQHRTVAGDLCDTAVTLGPNQSLDVDLCEAWNDYDPGAFSCSPCSLPGPEIVASIDTQPGEMIRINATVLSGSADVRLYLATDCEDPANSCLAASSGPSTEFQHAVTAGGVVYLFVDTTGECATVQVLRQMPASAQASSFSALKAIYR